MLDKKKINFRRKRMMTPDKHYRYSIRKFNVGIASVAIAAFMFLGNGAVSVSANDLASNEEVIPTSGPVSEEDLSSSAEIKESELVPSSTPNTGTPAETPAQTEKVVAEETVPVTENADSLPTNESQQESLSTKESDDALAAAKKVLEEVISEAEVLSADALRKAAKSTADTSSLQSAANATKAAAEAANQVFADEHASLEDINAQITAIRTAVGNLVPELTSFTGTEEVTVMLAATTSGAADANQSGIDAISANNGQYTVTSEHTNFKWTDILENPIIALKMTDGTYKYKKFSGSVTMDIAKAAYVADEFVDAATYKTANGTLQATDKVYIIQETDFTTDPTSISIEESYDLTKFHHRKHLIFGGDSIYEGATVEGLADADADSSAFIALARPGSFVSEIKFHKAEISADGGDRYLPKENNTLLVADSISEALSQSEPSYKNFGLFLSHIAVSDDKVNKPNTVMELPQGVEVVFADQTGQQTTFAEAMDEIMAALQEDENYEIVNHKDTLKFKFIVKKDGQIIKEDAYWREITLHVYSSAEKVKGLVKTKLTNTANNFEAGIVDNIDFSGLPEEMRNEAIDMEKTYPNVDGSLPQDGQLPEFSNPDNKDYDWIDKDREASDGNHATSPARYFPYDMDLFQGDGNRINEKLRGYIPELPDYKHGNGDDDIIAIPPSEHDQKLMPYYTLGSIFTKTMFDRGMTPEQGGVNKSYWHSLTQAMPIPQLDFEPEVNLDIVTLSDNPQPNPKGTVKIVYKALNADGTDVDSSVVLRADVTDTEDAAVGTPWNAAEQEKDEKPETLTHEATNTVYHLVKTAVVVPGVDGESTQTEGTVVAGDTVVTYFYAPEQTETIPTENKAKVTVNYYILDTSTPLQPSYEDTPATKISETVTTNTYYLDANNERVPVGAPKVVTNPVDPAVTYNTTETKNGKEERPTTLESGGKTYHLVEAATTFTEGTGVSGTLTKDTVVNYYYAEEQVEEGVIEEKGNVTVKYETEGGTTLKPAYKDSENVLVSSTPTTRRYYLKDGNKVYLDEQPVRGTTTKTDATYDTREDKSATGGVNEKPATLTDESGTTYHLIKTKDKTPENGTLPAGDTVVTYVYAPEQTEIIPTENKAKVTVNYYILGTSTPLQPSYEDTPATKISETVTTNTYYLDANNERVPVGDPAVVINPVDPAVTYNTTLTKADGTAERPTTLESGGKTYHLVEAATTFTEGTGVSGTLTKDTVVNYYYAEIKEEVTTEPTNGSVTIKYEATDGTSLRDDKEDTASTVISTKTTTKKYYVYNGEKVYVGDPVESTETKDLSYDTTEEDKDEKPETLQKDGKTYQRVAVKAGSADENGKVTGDHVVTYVYAEIKDEVTTEPTNGSVTIKYEATDGTPLRDDKEDTASTVISTKTTTKKYYEYDGQKVYVGDPVESTETVDLSYDTTEADKDEKPETLQKDGKTYQRVAVKAGSADENGKVTGDHVVTYVYAEIKEEVTTEPTNGSVTIKYEATDGTPLRDDKEDTALTVISTKTTTKKYYEYDGQKVYVGDPVESTETVDLSYNTTEEDKDEKPETLQKDGKTYQRVAVKAGSADENGKVTGDHVVTYVYAEIKDEVTTEPTNGSVTIKYETTDGTPLRDDKEDTASTVISTKTTTKKYYEYDGQKVYVGDPVESTETKDLSYDTTEADKDEKPETLQQDGKTYQLVAVKAGSADEKGNVSGELVVTYVYAEVPEEPTPPTDGGVNPPTDGGVNPPTDGGVNPPTDGGTTPPTDGGTTPPTDGGTTPPTDGGTTPPTDGGTTPTPPTGTITVTPKAGTTQLPNTGEASTSPLYGVLAFATGLAGLFGLVKKKEEDQ
ncbi:TPA: YSIRK-type signal peptide-containing protein [Streptococcus suis 89-5259]|nr:YSIRK-type signal peptide-containing protein [Streptococcus suis 89-5259]